MIIFCEPSPSPLPVHSTRHMINHHAELDGIEQHITSHMFRHSFSTLLLDQNVDIRHIQRILEHNSINTTEIYTHVLM